MQSILKIIFLYLSIITLALALSECKNKEDVFVDQTILTPTLSPGSGLVPYKTTVHFQSNQTNAILEYSLDNGKSWQTGDSVQLESSVNIQVRNRIDKNVSTTATNSYTLNFEKVLIIGNSITRHSPAPEIGWKGDWGMAASAADKDYVSLVKKYLSSRNSTTQFLVTNKGSSFEVNYGDNFDWNLFNNELAFKPDLIIVRIGDNVEDKKVNERQFEVHFEKLIAYLTSFDFQGKVICTGSFWERWEASSAIERVCKRKGYCYIELTSLNTQKNTAYNQFINQAVSSHPSDRGMEEIYKRLTPYF
ncbi:hypothetical protein BWI96_08445 [Siphonobacter sp. SORGH_AS_0500]|uniref:SGNH/GDSL hydrolase family protein n=1 Tax=Siphonobacter sp. SORGH_AS_0500 TaxID=1864824 RepID=UPI000CB28FBE|nr:SGNH/GDSL hydrolase family protein [Siphonobacter sp. SORGH_AS_0500]PKK36914.1 hypothetical protein BWI96_08445 [Siphonobacter sp. SORGH_AS_0500]